MQSFAASTGLPTGPKNYVFVDEHNRHKRLKVMRACEGCRRRKIKCDSATTNSWPCAACTRLKLHCVPPVGGIEGDTITTSFTGSENQVDFQNYSPSDAEEIQSGHPDQHTYPPSFRSNSIHSTGGRFDQYSTSYPKSTYTDTVGSFDDAYIGHKLYHSNTVDSFPAGRPPYLQTHLDVDTQTQSSPEHYTAEDLSKFLGELKISEFGVAPYIRQQNKSSREPDGPIQEPEMKLVAFSTDAGAQIRIPPALMPDQEDALRLFQTFFRDVHPYCPVLSRNQFYHQWHTNKTSISPLILEAVFACAGRMADDPAQGAQWLALANKHEACFLDTPRLSTLQALLLLLKARESAPKKGYYYRSWMTCKTIVSMAKDLELHEHHDLHKSGEPCGSDPIECLTKTRVWQTIFLCEMMIGAPQGRTDFGVDPSTIDVTPNPPFSDIDDFEKSISRQFAYFIRNARNIRLITDISYRIKKKKDWGLDKELVAYNTAFTKWPDDLPKDLQIKVPDNGQALSVASHFIGNMHSHYHLGIVMLRRPQLTASQSFATDSAWKHHMSVCYNSAKILCQLQEAILAKFDLSGLLCMQRGINFTIYAILTCVMIHLIAITSPDPELNSDARDYFVRHMRILEQCVSAWPMPETEAQINGLRAAFSADLNKPFDLKPSFPFGSPPVHFRPNPNDQPVSNAAAQQYLQRPPRSNPQSQSQPQPQQLSIPQAPTHIPAHLNHVQSAYLATPPVSAVSTDSQIQSPQFQPAYRLSHLNYNNIPSSNFYQAPSTQEEAQWNPTPIIDQFNTAFAIPASALAPPTSSYSSSPPDNFSGATSSYAPSTDSPAFRQASYPPPIQQQMYHQQMQQLPQQSRTYHQTQHQQSSYVAPTPVVAHSTQPQIHVTQQHQHHQPVQMTPVNTNTYTSSGGVFVSPQQWQQSVADVIDPSGLKRRWDFGEDEEIQHHG